MELRGHLAFHIGWQPYQCNVCRQTGGTEQEIADHFELVHPNAKTVCKFTKDAEKSKHLEEIFQKSIQKWKNGLREAFRTLIEQSNSEGLKIAENNPTPLENEIFTRAVESENSAIPKNISNQSQTPMRLLFPMPEMAENISHQPAPITNFTPAADQETEMDSLAEADNVESTATDKTHDGSTNEKNTSQNEQVARRKRGRKRKWMENARDHHKFCKLCTWTGTDTRHVWKHMSQNRYYCTGCEHESACLRKLCHLKSCKNINNVVKPDFVDRTIGNEKLLEEYRRKLAQCFGKDNEEDSEPVANEESNSECSKTKESQMSDESGNLAIPKIEVDLQLVKRETESPIDLSNCFSTAEVRKLTPTDDQKMKIESLSLDEANVESTTENRNHDYFSDGKNNQKEQVVVEGSGSSTSADDQIQCKLCQKMYMKRFVPTHVWTKHMSQRRYYCTGCDLKMSTNREYSVSHLKNCKNPNNVVPKPKIVDRCSSGNWQLAEDYSKMLFQCFGMDGTVTVGPDLVQCALCKRLVGKSNQNKSLSGHIWSYHMHRRYYCTGCGLKFAVLHSRNSHFKVCKNPRKVKRLEFFDRVLTNPALKTEHREKFKQGFGFERPRRQMPNRRPMANEVPVFNLDSETVVRTPKTENDLEPVKLENENLTDVSDDFSMDDTNFTPTADREMEMESEVAAEANVESIITKDKTSDGSNGQNSQNEQVTQSNCEKIQGGSEETRMAANEQEGVGEGRRKCKLCQKTLHKNSAYDHVWTKHMPQMRYYCTGCDYQVADSEKTKHLKTCKNPNNIPKPEIVDRCTGNEKLIEEFRQELFRCFGMDSNRFTKRYSQKNLHVSCALCERSVAKGQCNLRQHIWRYHMPKRYSCSGCDFQTACLVYNHHFKVCENPKKVDTLKYLDQVDVNPELTTEYREKFEQCFGIKLKIRAVVRNRKCRSGPKPKKSKRD